MPTNQTKPAAPIDDSTFRVYLFGALRVVQAGREVTVPAGRAQSLLAFLLLYPHVQHPRDRLVERLWPESGARGRRILSDTLYRLRQSVDGPWLVVDDESVGIYRADELWVDLWEFVALRRQGTFPARAAMVDLARSDLLADLADDWLLARRVRVHEQVLEALLQLGDAAVAQSDQATARRYYGRAKEWDALCEAAYAGLMRVNLLAGRVGDALELYEELIDLMEQELGVPPGAETRALAERLYAELALRRRRESAEPDPLRPPFVGRSRERIELLAAVDRALVGAGGCVAIEGAAGMGKSRLLEEIADGARWRGALVATAVAGDDVQLSPYTPLPAAMEALLAGPRAAQLALMLPGETMAAMAPLYPSWAAGGTPVDVPPEQALARFHRALLTVLATLADLTPLVIMLDDLHRADRALWDLLEEVAPALAERPVLLVLSFRRPEIETNPGWESIRNLERRHDLAVVTLPPLTHTDVTELLPDQPEQAVENALAATGGNPYYLTEVLVGLRSEQRIRRSPVLSRLENLQPGARQALQAAAVIGRDVPVRSWGALVERAWAMAPRTLVRHAQELCDAFLLRESEAGYLFPHDLVQESIYQATEAATRRTLHARIAAVLDETQPDNLRARALHHDRAGDAQAAATLYRRVGEREMELWAYADAVVALERALALTDPAPSRSRIMLLRTLAEACQVVGHVERSLQLLAEAQAAAERLDDSALLLPILIARAQALAPGGSHAEANKLLERAGALARQLDDRTQQAAAGLVQGHIALRAGRNRTAVEILEDALALARSTGNLSQQGRALDGLAWGHSNLGGDETLILALYQEALAVQQEAGNAFEEARVRLNLLSSIQNGGKWDQALAMADAVLDAQRRVGYTLGEAIARQNRGLIAYALGDYDRALDEQAEACRIFQTVGEQLGYAIARNSQGRVEWRLGHVDRAAEFFRESLAVAQSVGSAIFEGFAEQALGELLLEEGHPAQARPLLESAIAHWTESGEVLNQRLCETLLGHVQLALGNRSAAETLADGAWRAARDDGLGGEELHHWLWTLHGLLDALGRTAHATAALDAAYAELQRQAAVINDDQVRARFFRRVAINRAIVAAHDIAHGTRRTRTVQLAATHAPTGRPLRSHELRTVQWTVLAPEDESVADEVRRRRAALVRLLDQAAAAGAAATDQDLAEAFAVSRRTIQRDMDALRAAGVALSTRARR